MKDRFLPLPLPFVFSSTGIEWAKNDKEAIYLFLLQNVALKGKLLPKLVSTKFPSGIPYDYYCLFLGASNPSRTTVQTACQKSPLEAAMKSLTTKNRSPPLKRLALRYGIQ